MVDIRVRKTHDLEVLLNLCIEEDEEFEQLEKEKIAELSLYAVVVRYPEEPLDLELTKIRSLYRLAQEVREFILTKLTEKGFKK